MMNHLANPPMLPASPMPPLKIRDNGVGQQNYNFMVESNRIQNELQVRDLRHGFLILNPILFFLVLSSMDFYTKSKVWISVLNSPWIFHFKSTIYFPFQIHHGFSILNPSWIFVMNPPCIFHVKLTMDFPY